MMRLLFTLIIIIAGNMVYSQGGTTADYYQYQRDQQFKKYMETTGSQGMAGSSNARFNYSIDKNAVNEMVELWDRRAGRKTAAQAEAERAAEKKKWEAKRQQELANDHKRQQQILSADARKAWANLVTYRYVEYFNKVGFLAPDVPMMALNWVQEVMVNNQPDIEEVYHDRSEMAAKAFQQYKRVEQTATLEELLGLVAAFDMAGYTATKSLEKLKKRFPAKESAIDVIMPFHGIAFWQTLGQQRISFNSTFSSSFIYASDEQKKEMNAYLLKWLRTTPGTISFLKDDKEAIEKLVSYVVEKKDKELLNALLVSAAMYEPKVVKWINSKTQDQADPNLKTSLEWEDLEAIRKFHGITGFEAVQMINDVEFLEAGYSNLTIHENAFVYDRSIKYLKWYADAGDPRALNVYAFFTLKGKTTDKKEAAYEMFKKAMDAGALYATNFLKDPSIHRKMGIKDWWRYLRELEFTYVKPEIVKEYMSDKSKPVSEQKMKIEFPGKPDKTIYYFGQIKNGMANGRGMGLFLDGFVYYGDWVNNQFHGFGTLDEDGKWKNDYTGIFLNGKKNGYYNHIDKGIGHFKDDVWQRGNKYTKMEFMDPISGYTVKYNGLLEKGKANGYGNAQIYDGSNYLAMYQGYWKDNTMNGFGYLKKFSPDKEYRGEFNKGKFIQKKDEGNDSVLLFRQIITGKRIEKVPASPNFDNWITASENFEWLALESPVNDDNIHRHLKNGALHFKTFSKNYTWGITALTGKQLYDYTYEAIYVVEKQEYDYGECGLLIDIDENKGGYTSKLLFLINPGAQTFYLGSYNPATDKWTSFTNPHANGGWQYSKSINTFSGAATVNNKLTIKKAGNEIAVYANDMLLFTQKITAAMEYLHRFAGIGITQAQLIKGSIPMVSFKASGH